MNLKVARNKNEWQATWTLPLDKEWMYNLEVYIMVHTYVRKGMTDHLYRCTLQDENVHRIKLSQLAENYKIS